MSLQPSSNSLSPAYLGESNKTPVYVAVAVGFVLSNAGVILRGIAKRKADAPVGWDDYTILFALVSFFQLTYRGFTPGFSLCEQVPDAKIESSSFRSFSTGFTPPLF